MDIVRNKQNGFSFVELLVSMVSMLILMAAIYTVFTIQSQQATAEEEIINLQMNAHVALERLEKIFSNAGFGCYDSFEDGKTISGNDLNGSTLTINAFLYDIQNNDVTSNQSDSVIVTLAFKKVAEVNGNYEDANLIDFKNIGTPTISDLETSFKNYVAFFPDLDGDQFYRIVNDVDPYLLDQSVKKLFDDSDVFMVTPIKLVVENSILYLKNYAYSTTVSPDQYWEIASNVLKFHIQYTEDGITWLDVPNDPQNVKGVWVFLLFRSDRIQPGYQDNKTYTLAGVNISNLPGGYHYLLAQRKIWIRNAQ